MDWSMCLNLNIKYLGCVLEEPGTDEAECRRKVANWRRIPGAFRSLVNAWGLQLESLLRPVLMYGNDTMI